MRHHRLFEGRGIFGLQKNLVVSPFCADTGPVGKIDLTDKIRQPILTTGRVPFHSTRSIRKMLPANILRNVVPSPLLVMIAVELGKRYLEEVEFLVFNDPDTLVKPTVNVVVETVLADASILLGDE